MSVRWSLRLAAGFCAFIASQVPASAGATDPPATDVYIGGLDGSVTHAHGGDRDGRLGALGLASSHNGFGFEDPLTVRVTNTASIGTDGHGFQGGLGTALAGGPRLSLGKNHGVFARGGIEGYFFGNRCLWDSLLEFPQGQLGYQWLVPRSVVDVAFKGGYVLAGRHNTGDSAMRELDGSFEIGAIGAVHLGSLDLRVNYTRVLVDNGATPVDMFEGAACGIGWVIALCTNVRYEVGDALLQDGSLRPARVSFVGLTAGVLILDRYKRVRKTRQ